MDLFLGSTSILPITKHNIKYYIRRTGDLGNVVDAIALVTESDKRTAQNCLNTFLEVYPDFKSLCCNIDDESYLKCFYLLKLLCLLPGRQVIIRLHYWNETIISYLKGNPMDGDIVREAMISMSEVEKLLNKREGDIAGYNMNVKRLKVVEEAMVAPSLVRTGKSRKW